MSQPRHHSTGFSTPPKQHASQTKATRSSADYAAKEHKAAALINQGKLQEAEVICKQLIRINTENHIPYCNLAAAYGMQGRLDECIVLLKKALDINPNLPESHYNLGNALKDQGELTGAIDAYNKALQLKPNYPEAHLNTGVALKKQGDISAAIASFNKALQLKPNYVEAHYNLGNALKLNGELTAAIDAYNKALKLKPNLIEAYTNLGCVLQEQGRLDDAITTYKKALKLQPNHPEAHKNIAMVELLMGHFHSGWQRYEYRFQAKEDQGILTAHPSCTKWNGEALLQNKKLLLVSEQGLGDTLQFMRYAIALKRQGTDISLCAPEKLHTLIQASGIDPSPLNQEQGNQATEGKWIPLLSVPRHLEVGPSNPVINEPYIHTSKEPTVKWKKILADEQRPIIGINWQGNPSQERTNSAGRSLSLKTFAPLANKSKTTLLSLQKGFGSEQLETCSFKDRFVSCQDQINETWDFLETAAIIANCDLIITSDTSVAHLAGGMGKTTWLLLKKVPDWRWGLDGETTFWYPSMRLFRQKERGNWDEVMQRVAEALQQDLGGGSVPSEPTAGTQPVIKQELTHNILAPTSLGELIDKITILQIKTQHLQSTALENVEKELKALEATLNTLQLNIDTNLIQRLKEVNQDLWHIEDDIREQERIQSFDENFIRLARSVYQQNDQRAAIKKEINTTYRSAYVEEKSYQQY